MGKISASLEDYLEVIYQLCRERQVARVKEIAERLEVADASVVGALRVLRRKRLVRQERYGYIRLTAEGELLAREVFSRHESLALFFREVLGLTDKAAEAEACRAEHCLEDRTIARLALLQKFLGSRLKKRYRLAEVFSEYVRGKEMLNS
jgi:DtxR family Mn-dependent transcriptional regulator